MFLENPFYRVGVAKAMVKCNTVGKITADSSYTAIDQEVKEASERSLKGGRWIQGWEMMVSIVEHFCRLCWK